MNDYADLTDEADQEWEHSRREEEHAMWLADEAAQIEYRSWLDLINAQLNAKDSRWVGSQATPAAETSNPHQQART